MKRYVVPLILGLGGTAILVTLAIWQVQRLAWKEALIAEISARISDDPVPLPDAPEKARDAYLPVAVSGQLGAQELHVLTSTKFEGPGFRVISALEAADGRRVLVDRGFIPEVDKPLERPGGSQDIIGNLIWPNETDMFTPDPNLDRNIWFARNVETMAAALNTEPLMIAARSPTGTPGPRPMPVTVNLPNNHLQYAITWSLLACLWLAMTGYLLYRIRRNTI